jgi:hypothetical protein
MKLFFDGALLRAFSPRVTVKEESWRRENRRKQHQLRKEIKSMTNNYQEPNVFEVGRAQDVVLGQEKSEPTPDNISSPVFTLAGSIDESDE